MGKVKKEDILSILDGYDKNNITIATLGSHTSLHILQGAKVIEIGRASCRERV